MIKIIKSSNSKVCRECKEDKTLDNYSKCVRHSDGYKHICKQCASKIEKERRLLKGGTNRVDRSSETKTTKICTKCLILRDKSEFNHNSWCKYCIQEEGIRYRRSKGVEEKFIPVISEDSKQCCKCKEIKPLDEYTNSSRGRLGKASYCKECHKLLTKTKFGSNENRRSYTQKYRDNNREWWRFLHRINQFNRNNKVKLASDGTITKEFMIKLYETEECYYCKNIINKEHRTCEHKQPLSKGGVHGISNLVMACVSCNSTKRDMTENEFNNYINKKLND